MSSIENKGKVIYLDNAATTKMSEEVKEAMDPYLEEKFGNASTMYGYGETSRQALEKARKTIAGTLEAKPSEIFFTSGGSESDNWAVKCIAGEYKHKGKHIITSKIEHHAILNSCKYLEELGYEVTYLDVDEYGMVSPEAVYRAIREDTTLITIMFGNNEVGTIEPVFSIGKIAREKDVLFHTDAVQAYAQVPISVRHYPVDLLSASAHKFHGPKGVGFLYIREGVQIPSFIHGGSQEKGKRAGTENIAGIVGMGKAAELAAKGMRAGMYRETMLRNYLIEKIVHEIPDVRVNGHRTKRLPGNVSVSFKGVDGASLLILLDLQQLDEEKREKIYSEFMGYDIPCVIFCRDLRPDDSFLKIAEEKNIPVLGTKRSTSEFMAELIYCLNEQLAPCITIHGVLVDVYGEGLLIMGESGIGKSEAALELIKRGHRLVTDDVVEIRKINEHTLIGTSPDITRYFIELRGIGIIDVKTLFGVECVKEKQQIDLVIKLEDWKKENEYDRLGLEEEYTEFLGNKVVCHSLPIRPGRNLAVICEAAAVNHRQKKMGYNAAQELYRRVQENLTKKSSDDDE